MPSTILLRSGGHDVAHDADVDAQAPPVGSETRPEDASSSGGLWTNTASRRRRTPVRCSAMA